MSNTRRLIWTGRISMAGIWLIAVAIGAPLALIACSREKPNVSARGAGGGVKAPIATVAADKQEEAKKQLASLSRALDSYAQKNKERYPASLEELTSPTVYIQEIPKDPYRPAASYLYKTWAGRRGYILYSVGPNEKDDNGADFDPRQPLESSGDICEHSSLFRLGNSYPEAKAKWLAAMIDADKKAYMKKVAQKKARPPEEDPIKARIKRNERMTIEEKMMDDERSVVGKSRDSSQSEKAALSNKAASELYHPRPKEKEEIVVATSQSGIEMALKQIEARVLESNGILSQDIYEFQTQKASLEEIIRRNQDAEDRYEEALKQYTSDKPVAVLVAGLQYTSGKREGMVNSDGGVRRLAARALVQKGSADSQQAIAVILNDEANRDDMTKITIIECLGESRKAEFGPILLYLFRKNAAAANSIFVASANALGSLKYEPALPELIDYLDREKRRPFKPDTATDFRRFYAIQNALSSAYGESAVPVLVETLWVVSEKSQIGLRNEIVQMLQKITRLNFREKQRWYDWYKRQYPDRAAR